MNEWPKGVQLTIVITDPDRAENQMQQKIFYILVGLPIFAFLIHLAKGDFSTTHI